MPSSGAPEEKSMGALIGSIIIIVILVIGGLYLWSSKMQDNVVPQGDDTALRENTEQQLPVQPSAQAPSDSAAAALSTQSSADDVSSIEKDLNSTSYVNMDAELQTI